jgi:hypothetical protein
MQYDNNGTMMSQRYVQWYDIPKADYEGSDCKSNMSNKAQDDIQLFQHVQTILKMKMQSIMTDKTILSHAPTQKRTKQSCSARQRKNGQNHLVLLTHEYEQRDRTILSVRWRVNGQTPLIVL